MRLKTVMTILLAIAALAGGIFMGYADAHSDDPPITLAILAIFTFLLGALGPRRPWLWPLLAGIWVPLLNIVLPRLGMVPSDPDSPPTVLSGLGILAVAMAACFAGSYAGAFMVRAVRRAINPQS
jgi:drug/metabolite transporter (DMT)-like permease